MGARKHGTTQGLFLLRFVTCWRPCVQGPDKKSIHKRNPHAYIDPVPQRLCRWVHPTPQPIQGVLKMRSLMKNLTCRFLIVALLSLSFQAARAGMIGADQAATAGAPQTDRGVVMSVLGRAETTAQLQAAGIDPAMARERVAAMTDQEVQALASDLQNAPAGAALHAGGYLAIVLVAGLIWYFAYRR